MRQIRLAMLGTTLSLLGATAPVSAQVKQEPIDPAFYQQMLKTHGIDVYFGRTPQNPSGMQRYLYNPYMGAFRLGEDPNFAGLNPIESRLLQSVLLPGPDPVYTGKAFIPYTSGAINKFDVNRALIDEGMREAAPDAFRNPNVFRPWYSIDDGQVCSAAAEKAWTFSTDVIAPEVEAFRAHLPNQKVATDVLVLGSSKPDFTIKLPSVFGSIYIKDGAKALVCRSADALRVFNLTGKKDSVIVKFTSGRVIAIGPGSELVAARAREQLMANPHDTILRRGASRVITTQGTLVVINEIEPASVLKATGLSRALATTGDTADKRLCNSVIKSSAILATMRGAGGYTAGPRDRDSILAQRHAWPLSRDLSQATPVKNAAANQPKSDLVLTSAKSSEPPAQSSQPAGTKQSALKRCATLIRKPLTVMRGNNKQTN